MIFGVARLGMVRYGAARLGPVRYGLVRRGWASHTASSGVQQWGPACQGSLWQDMAVRGPARLHTLLRYVGAEVWHGEERRRKAGHGSAVLGAARQVVAWCGSANITRGNPRSFLVRSSWLIHSPRNRREAFGMVWLGWSSPGLVKHGWAGLGNHHIADHPAMKL